MALAVLGRLVAATSALAQAPAPAERPAAPAEPQPSHPAAQAPPANAERSTTVLEGPELEGILGHGVLSRTGDKMGQVVDVIIDRTGQVRAAIIDFGGFLGVGSRKIAIDWHAVHFVVGGKSIRIVLDLTPDELKGVPEYKPGEKAVIVEPRPGAAAPISPPQKE